MENQDFSRKINYIDLFAGAGGLSEGFIREGYHPIAHVEKNSQACLTVTTRIVYHYLKEQNLIDQIYNPYLRNEISREDLYGKIPKHLLNTVINKEITTESIDSIFSQIDENLKLLSDKKVDLIIGGPPCQAYSIAGRVAIVNDKERLNDPRRFLYRQYIKFLIKYAPKLFVFENVPGILNARDSEGNLFIDKMKAANFNLLEGTLYPLLTRLKNAEFLTYRWVESNSGPPRKYFSLTEKGAAFYKELEATWNELANAVKAVTEEKQQTF